MKHITKLLYLLELTRAMPQYGYALAGGNQRLGNLAEHHYLVTMTAWQLARGVKNAGAKIDVEKVMEYTLTHDLGELFGGDISMPYAKVNPEARKQAKAFEAENQKFLSNYFGPDKDYFNSLLNEIMEPKSDEALIYKVADLIETKIYKQFIERSSERDLELVRERLRGYAQRFADPIARNMMIEFMESWLSEVADFSTYDVKIKDILDESGS